MGLCLSFNCAAEVPVFYLSGGAPEGQGLQGCAGRLVGATSLNDAAVHLDGARGAPVACRRASPHLT